MSALQNINLDLDIFYRNPDLPKISLGDKVKVVIYLELPKEQGEGEKKGEGGRKHKEKGDKSKPSGSSWLVSQAAIRVSSSAH